MKKHSLFLFILGSTVIGFAAAQPGVELEKSSYCKNLEKAVCNDLDLDCSAQSNLSQDCESAWGHTTHLRDEYSIKKQVHDSLIEKLTSSVCVDARIASHRAYEEWVKSKPAPQNDEDCKDNRESQSMFFSEEDSRYQDCENKFKNFIRSSLSL